MNKLATLQPFDSPTVLLISVLGLAVIGLAVYLRLRPLRPRIAVRPGVVPRSPRPVERAELERSGRIGWQAARRVSIEIHNRGQHPIHCKALGFGSRPHPLGERELREATAASARSVQPEQPWPGPLAAGSALTLEADLEEMKTLVDDLKHGFLGRVWVATETGERFHARLSHTKRFIRELEKALKAEEHARQTAALP